MDNLKIIIADDDEDVSSTLSLMLEKIGHIVVGCAGSGSKAIELARRLRPDMVFMDIRMEDMNGLDASRIILDQNPVPIVIVTAFSDPGLIEQADDIGVAGYLIKPFSIKEIQPALTLAWSRFNQIRDLKQEVGSLKESIQARKLIERAKGLLMERDRISEAEAFRRIQQTSRNQNITMMRIAESIILADKLMCNQPLQPAMSEPRPRAFR